MPKSYRIRTDVGVDKSVSISIDQEFEYLEILSLKVLQSDIYTRVCSDYGVVIGRVSVNDGFGIPNAKVSIFIPLSNEDAENPIISEIYPYRTILDVNEDGYRYNLLPYEPSYSAHRPTGTFPSKTDILTNPTLIEVYDKYYKLNAVTNQSGDFMIFGVPVGSQTLVVDIDLSDIGEFSLSPQDLIRMGIATDSQVSGTSFKTSTNLKELPQIVSFTRTIVVEPLWGQSEICNLGITRTDFDLSNESNINIEPTAIFMGSLISTNDDQFQKKNCKPKTKSGQLCDLTTGPGEILAIRQTIFLDVNGRPGLETFDLEQGGQVIDENGTWLIDVPMNLDYLITNEFGDQIISDDPKKGIPTRGKYRFKVKWNQSPTLNEPIRRGYYLVPNIKEYGWIDSSSDPRNEPPNSTEYINFVKSYSFSLDWNDYPNIQEAIDCEDRFYMMSYNKVYTVSQLITQYRKGYAANSIISIKNIVSDECSSDTNKFPTNDAVYRFDLIFFLLKILSYVFKPTLIGLVIVAHIVYIAIFILSLIIQFLIYVVGVIVIVICNFIKLIVRVINAIPGVSISAFRDKCPTLTDVKKLANRFKDIANQFRNIKIPNLSYPDCDVCNCNDSDQVQAESDEETAAVSQQVQNTGGAGAVSNFFEVESYPITGTTILNTQDNYFYQQLFTGLQWIQGDQYTTQLVQSRAPQLITITTPNPGTPPPINLNVTDTFTSSIPIGERLNLFNTKAKYFNGPQDMPSISLNGTCRISNLASPTPAAGNKMTVLTISDAYLFIGAVITGSFTTTTILSQVSGTPGGIGVYIVSNSQFVSSTTSFSVLNFSIDSPNSLPLYDNPGGGVNRIKVKVEKTIPTNSGKFHLDNVIALVVKNEALTELESGKIISFQDPELSMDKNMTGATLNFDSRQSIVGKTLTPLISGRAKVNSSPTIPITSGNTLTVIDISYIDNPNVNGLLPNTQIEIEGDVDGLGNQIIRKIVSQNTITPPSNNLPPTPYGLGTYTIDGPATLIVNPNKFVVVTPTTRQLSYADPSGSGVDISVTYDLTLRGNPQFPDYDYLKFPMDLEYCQVITGMTYSDYLSLTNPSPNTTSVASWDNLTFNRRFLDNDTMIYNVHGHSSNFYLYNQFGGTATTPNNPAYLPKIQYNFNDDFTDLNEQGVIFLVRGVDPHSARVNIEYDLSKLFGFYNFGTGPIVSGKFKLNHPIKGGFKTVNHDNINFNDDTDSSYSGLKLFYPSFYMTLEPNGSQPEVPPPYQPISTPPDPPVTPYPNIIIGSGFSAFTSNTISYYSSFDNSTLTSLPLFNPGNGCPYSNPISVGGFGPSNPTVPPITDGAVSNSKGARLRVSNFTPIPPTSPIDLSNERNNKTKGNNGFVVEWKQYANILSSDVVACTGCGAFGTQPCVPIWSPGVRYNTESNTFGTNTTKNRGYFETEIVEGSGFMYQDIDMGQSFWFFGGAFGLEKCRTNYSGRKADGFYYAPGYSQTNTLVEFRDRTLMVMRSDKLPTSTSLQPNYCNTFPLHNNNNFTIFTFTDDGTTGVVGGLNGSTDISTFADLDNGSKRINQVLSSFSCANMAPLPCYNVTQEGPFSGTGLCTSEFNVAPKSDSCWESGPGVGNKGFEGGCYVFVTVPLLSLVNGHDLRAIFEWSERILITFAACRDVFSHLFTNNWVNGTLYAWSFNNNVTYTSPLAPNGNQPSSQFCKDTIMLHPTTNNFYYRSSPYNDSNDTFVGAERPNVTGLFRFGSYSGNFYNLLYPTTIIDLGPRNNYMQEIVMSDEFDGYVANKLGPTSFQDVSDLLNLFLISRLGNLGNFNIIALLTGRGVQIESFFDRNPQTGILGIGGTKMVDGDYAQMVAINSELGVIPFNEINYQDYTQPGIQDPIFITGGGYKKVVIGVFYRANLQLRDFITPKRTIIDGLAPITTQVSNNCTVNGINCNVNYFPVKSQKVPFYNWEIGDGGPTYCTGTATIFGSQQNDWYTNPINANGGFMAHRYQDLKREEPTSRYFRTEPNTLGLNYYPGFISAVQASGPYLNPITNDYYRNSDGYYNYTADETYWDQTNDSPRAIHTGAPFYFYFGLKKGKTAYDRFSKKWIPTQTILTYE